MADELRIAPRSGLERMLPESGETPGWGGFVFRGNRMVTSYRAVRTVNAQREIELVGKSALAVFELRLGQWDHVTDIPLPPGAIPNRFDFWGDRIIVSDPHFEIIKPSIAGPESCLRAGSVFVFEQAPGNHEWQFKARLEEPTPSAENGFGSEIALEGDRIVVASRPTSPGCLLGSIYVFEWNEPFWIAEKLPGKQGSTIALCSDRIALGSPCQNQVELYENRAGQWTRTKIPSPQGAIGFGDSLALDQNRLLVTAPDDASTGAYLYTFDGEHWNPASISLPGGQKPDYRHRTSSAGLRGNLAFLRSGEWFVTSQGQGGLAYPVPLPPSTNALSLVDSTDLMLATHVRQPNGSLRTEGFVRYHLPEGVHFTSRVLSPHLEAAGTITGHGYYPRNSPVLFQAIPKPGYIFSHWSGGLSGSENPTTLSFSGDIKVSARFIPMTSDLDGDGISYIVEQGRLGTKPHHPDSDRDGLSDREEIEQHGTNPLSWDTDGDGFGDGRELLLGSSPTRRSDTPLRISLRFNPQTAEIESRLQVVAGASYFGETSADGGRTWQWGMSIDPDDRPDDGDWRPLRSRWWLPSGRRESTVLFRYFEARPNLRQDGRTFRGRESPRKAPEEPCEPPARIALRSGASSYLLDWNGSKYSDRTGATDLQVSWRAQDKAWIASDPSNPADDWTGPTEPCLPQGTYTAQGGNRFRIYIP